MKAKPEVSAAVQPETTLFAESMKELCQKNKQLTQENQALKAQITALEQNTESLSLIDPETMMSQENSFYQSIIQELCKEIISLTPKRP